MGFEQIPHKTVTAPEAVLEAAAEAELELLLEDPQNKFLLEVEQNKLRIDNAPTAQEALAFAQSRIKERLERTLELDRDEDSAITVDAMQMHYLIESIRKNQQVIGEGGDAWVVIDKNEVRTLPPEICYKLFKKEATPRGRNSAKVEHDLQSLAHKVLNEGGGIIQAPVPYYALEIGAQKMIAMEKLDARSIDDLLRGIGTLPTWLNIDEFCNELKVAISRLHEKGLYHRDLHLGNVMIKQSPTAPAGAVGYIIDFGLSGIASDETYAYVKEVADSTFTYNNDYGIVETARNILKSHRDQQGDV